MAGRPGSETAPAVPVTTRTRYARVLLKLSGDAFAPPGREYGIAEESVELLARQLAEITEVGAQTAVVVGGGNIFRGRDAPNMDHAQADYVGMLATVMNALVLQDALERIGVLTRVQTAIAMAQVAEPYVPRKAMRHLEKGRIVIFAAGVGRPFFSTDTAAAQIALDIHAEAILKGTGVDGVYDADPNVNPSARRFEDIGYTEVLTRGLRVMDATAISLCRENGLPIIVFDFREPGNILRAVRGEHIGTLVHAGGEG